MAWIRTGRPVVVGGSVTFLSGSSAVVAAAVATDTTTDNDKNTSTSDHEAVPVRPPLT